MSHLELLPSEGEIRRNVAEAQGLAVANPAQPVSGDLLINPDTPLPSGLRGVSLQQVAICWNLLFGMNASECDRLIRSEGWHFFFLVQALESTAVAATAPGAIRAEREGINAIEIK